MKLFYFNYKSKLDNCVSCVIANTYDEAESHFIECNSDIIFIDNVRVTKLNNTPIEVYTSKWKRGLCDEN